MPTYTQPLVILTDRFTPDRLAHVALSDKPMTGAEYSATVDRLGLNQSSAARLLDILPRQSRRYVAGDADIPQPTARYLRLLLALGIKVED